MDSSPQQLIRSEILAMSAYPVANSAGLVKLDAMENPYSLPEALQTQLGDLLGRAAINRYPDPQSQRLKSLLASVMKVPSGMEIVLGNGSDELIQIIAFALARPGAVLLSVEPSFVMYKMVAAFCGMRYVGVPLKPDFSLDLDAVQEAMQKHRPALVFIANPNNPTGNLFASSAIDSIIERAPGIVVVDEAYFPFNDSSFMPRLVDCPRLLVMRTVSKLGLAGLRLGMLAGRGEWTREFDKLRMPYNINVLTQVAAETVLNHAAILREQALEICIDRERLMATLRTVEGVQVYPSAANFILLRVDRAEAVFDGLRQRGILVKNLSNAHPLLANCLRTTIGTPQENERFVGALKESLLAQA
jgi:histidinol-phosphate aminotransferase